MKNELIILGATTMGSLFSGFITHLITKRKYNQEVKSDEITNLASSLDIYKNLVQDLSDRLNSVDLQVDTLRNDVLRLHKENLELKKENESLRKMVESFHSGV